MRTSWIGILLGALTSCLVLGTAATSLASDRALGLSVLVLPDRDDRSEGRLGRGQELWFPLQPGESRDREVRVRSTADADQVVQVDLLSLLNVDGRDRADPETVSPITDWFTFAPSEFVLAAQGEQIVTMTVTAPVDADGAFTSMVSVSARGPLPQDSAVTEGIGATVGTAIAIDKKVWVGVGDNAFLTTDFEIVDVVGLTIDDQRTLQIEINNTGGTPIAPRGTVELQSSEFTTLQAGPIDFRVRETLPGEGRFTRVDLPEEVVDGLWTIYIVADQGDIRRTALFDSNLTFPSDPSDASGLSTWQLVLIALLVLTGLLLLGWGVRALRTHSGRRKLPRQ